MPIATGYSGLAHLTNDTKDGVTTHANANL